MKKHFLFLMSMLLTFMTVATAQDTLDVAPGIGTLNDAINANKGDKVYRLQAGLAGYYVLSEIIENSDYELTIIGAEPGAGEMPATLQTNAVDGVPFDQMFIALGNITLKNIYFVNAASNGAVGFYFLRIQKPEIRVIVDKCIIDPSGHILQVDGGGNNKMYFTNNLIMRMMSNTSSINCGTMFRLAEAASTTGVDTFLLENNTMVGIGTNLLSNDFSAHLVHNYMSINHNTFVHLKAQIDWLHNQENFYFTNNLLYDFGAVPYPAKWAGGWDGYPVADTVVNQLIWAYPQDSVVDKATATNFVAYNSIFLTDPVIESLDSLKTWIDTFAIAEQEFFYLQPLVWSRLDDVPTNLGIDTAFAFANCVEADLFNNPGYPNWKAIHNTYGTDPNFNDDSIAVKSEELAAWAIPAYKKDYRFLDDGGELANYDWHWDHDGDISKNDAWPVFNGVYSDAETMVASIERLPMGDLNWFQEKKAIWEANKEAIDAHIKALNTDQMDLNTSIFSVDADDVNLVSVYPNPFDDNVKFDLGENVKDHARIRIFNTVGQLVESLDCRAGVKVYTWNAPADLAPGLYFFDVIVNGVKDSGRLMKK